MNGQNKTKGSEWIDGFSDPLSFGRLHVSGFLAPLRHQGDCLCVKMKQDI